MPGPTDQEQLFLELINEARIDPMRNAARYITSYSPLISTDADIQNAINYFHVAGADLLSAYQALTAVAPLAWNGGLATAAEKHSAALIAADAQSHQLPGEPGLGARILAEGYNYTWAGENVYSYADSIIHGHAGFMIDWGNGPSGMQSPAGHRDNIMSTHFTEVGIDVTAENIASTNVGPLVVTQDFGDRNLTFVLGVAYSDNDHNQFYSIGEGRSDFVVSAGGGTTTSTSSGGYSLSVGSGLQTISLSGGGLSGAITVRTTIDDNIKLDVVDGNTLLTSGSVEVTGFIGTIRGIGTLHGGLTITVGAGNNRIVGTIGNDTLGGGDGNDTLEGGNGNDTLDGGTGNDDFTGGAGADIIRGGDGNDVAIYAGARSAYTVTTLSGGRISVTGGDSGGDTLEGIETLRFSDGDVTAGGTPVGGGGTTGTNRAPTVVISQSLSLNEDTPKQVVVTASDPDGDPLTFTATGVAHGVVTGGTNGVFVYTPGSNFNGSDGFAVTISDGKGGTVMHSVSLNVIAQNDAPTVAGTQNTSTAANTPRQINVVASDVDGNTLTFTAGTAAHGSVTGGASGAFVYTPAAGFSGTDSFQVTVSDGAGGTAGQTVNVAVSPAPVQAATSANDFRLLAADGFVGTIGGGGVVFGTSGMQDITLVDRPGEIRFDASFNRGGDIIRLPGIAADYTVALSGSSAVFDDGDSRYSIPLGTAGTKLVFDDGVRNLGLVGGAVKFGSQSVTTAAADAMAPSDNSSLPGGANTNAQARIFLAGGADVSIGGDQRVFGTTGVEHITYLGGDLIFDPSFNRGGDTLSLPDAPSVYRAYVSGSSAVIVTAEGNITIPVGTTGMTIDFAGEARSLRLDPTSQTIRVGDVSITGATAASPVALDGTGSSGGGTGGGSSISLDVGTGGTVAPITLQAGVSYVLTDDVHKDTNVTISGFTSDDLIRVTGSTASQYNYSSNGKDLEVSQSDGTHFNLITILNVVDATDIVVDFATAQAAIGHSFMTFA